MKTNIVVIQTSTRTSRVDLDDAAIIVTHEGQEILFPFSIEFLWDGLTRHLIEMGEKPEEGFSPGLSRRVEEAHAAVASRKERT